MKIKLTFQHSLENKINGSVKCNALDRSIGILADGTVISCAWGIGRDGSPLDKRFILGNMPKHNLNEVLNSINFIEWKKNKYKKGKAICQVEEMIANI